MQRRGNLKRSTADFKIQFEDAKAGAGDSFEELKKVGLLDGRDQIRERAEPDAIGA
jgi:hypothetical protein